MFIKASSARMWIRCILECERCGCRCNSKGETGAVRTGWRRREEAQQGAEGLWKGRWSHERHCVFEIESDMDEDCKQRIERGLHSHRGFDASLRAYAWSASIRCEGHGQRERAFYGD